MSLESNLPKPEQADLLCNCSRGTWLVQPLYICPDPKTLVPSTISRLECQNCTSKFLLYDGKLYSNYGQDASRVVAEFIREYNASLEGVGK